MKKSIGIILDGNRRWARAHGLDAWEGHRAGAERVRELVRWAKERDDGGHIFLYAFSTENWKREAGEIEKLFGILESFFEKYLDELAKEGVRLRIAGERERFPKKLQNIFASVEEKTKDKTELTVWFGLSYGGRAEILDAVSKLGCAVTDAALKEKMWTADLPDPDLIIRMGGEKRLSNFLTWSSVYSELFFTDTLWPAITREEFFTILDEYEKRDRRIGA